MSVRVRRVPLRFARRARSRGFSLTELMAVVAIMGILATLGIAAFNRRAFASSVPDGQVVLRAIGVAEERYRSMNQSYLDVSASPGNAGSGWYPIDPVIPVNQKVSFVFPAHPDYAPALPRRGWRHLNAPVTKPVGFTFKVNAGLPSTPITTVALATPTLNYAANAGTDPWYVAQAHADGNGDGTYCVMVATSFTPDVRVVNEGE
jgi:prepilin-type N-terminal cleavage/methylation domain-containing protein